MRVLMFGWEFPPHSSGGLGTACYGLTKGLTNQDTDVTFILPSTAKIEKSKAHVKLIVAENIKEVKIKQVDSLLVPYINSETYGKRYHRFSKSKSSSIYGNDLYEEVQRYAQQAALIAREELHDIIHCHDWMTYPAGIEAKKVSGKPLVIHVHATEFDRTGDNPNQYVYDIEKKGMEEADHIMSVSQFTKNKIIKHYDINPEKITVVHNAVEFNENRYDNSFKLKDNEPLVLFLGRITLQKGPDYFLYAAKRVLEIMPHVKFVIAGNGDMEGFIIEKAAEMGIADRVLFTGFLSGKDVDRIYSMADLYVMPSISEPFGITPLEAMRNNTPVLISKQSGVSEVLTHALKVDFWDTEKMANQIIGVLRYKQLHQCLQENGAKEITKFDWNIPARKCIDVYDKVLGAGGMGLGGFRCEV